MTLPTAHQHARCWQALTAVRATIGQYTPAGRGQLDAQVSKITRWAEACAADLRRKRPSAGATRDTEAACARMQAHMAVDGLDGDALYQRWTAAVWASLTLLEDCRNTCPVWFAGPHWRYLLQTLTTLAMAMYRDDPCVAEAGTRIYMEVA